MIILEEGILFTKKMRIMKEKFKTKEEKSDEENKRDIRNY